MANNTGETSGNNLLPLGEAPVTHPLDDRYLYYRITEADNPELVHEAWRMHGVGYAAAGFVEQSALGEDGLPTRIDKARGDNVDYYLTLSRDPNRPGEGATMRKIHVREGETFRDLPAFQLTKDTIYDEDIAYLESITPQTRLKEISAMARTSADPMSMYEIIRQITREAYGKNEVWFFGIVVDTLDYHLVPNLGVLNFQVIGGEARIDDDRVKKNVRLQPVLFHPDKFLTNMLKSRERATNPASRRRLDRSLGFFLHSLPPEQLAPEIIKALAKAHLAGIATRQAFRAADNEETL